MTLARVPCRSQNHTESPLSSAENWNIGSNSSKSLIHKGKSGELLHFYIRTKRTTLGKSLTDQRLSLFQKIKVGTESELT
jgi:hypothetical protein